MTMKILIAPGTFKHSLNARKVAQRIAAGLERSGLAADLHLIPIADGGNDTVEAWLANGGERISVEVNDPLMRPVQATYGILPDKKTAVIEMAQASGIELLPEFERNPLKTTTYGTGELLKDALERGIRRFIIGMGGSATVDGGAGALQALGLRLMAVKGTEIPPGGGGLINLHAINPQDLDPRWRECEVIIASDVDNPTLGEQGAAAVFGPQKGASKEDVFILERNLTHFFNLVAENHGVDVRTLRGGGAAGALSAGLIAFLNGRIESGIELLLHYRDFETHLQDAALVITGEGRMDEQTVHGKGPIGVARLAREQGVPTVALVGGLAVDDVILHDAGIQVVLPVVNQPMPLEDALKHAGTLIEQTALRLGYLLQLKHIRNELDDTRKNP